MKKRLKGANLSMQWGQWIQALIKANIELQIFYLKANQIIESILKENLFHEETFQGALIFKFKRVLLWSWDNYRNLTWLLHTGEISLNILK